MRKAFAAVFDAFPDAHWDEAAHFVSGDRGVSEWTLSGTDAEDGTQVEEEAVTSSHFKMARYFSRTPT